MYLDGWSAELEMPDQALAKWQLLAKLYPDYGPGPHNAAIQLQYQNRFAEMLPYLRTTLADPDDMPAQTHDMMGRAELGLESYGQAEAMFDKALEEKGIDSLRRRADVSAARRKFAEAEALLAKAPADNVYPWIDRISIAADQGQWAEALHRLDEARKAAATIQGDPIRMRAFAVTEASLLLAMDRKAEAAKLAAETARQSVRALDSDTPADLPDELDVALSAALVALRAGDGEVATEALAAVDARPHLRDLAYISEMRAVVHAWQSIGAGRGNEAIALLKPFADGSARYQTHRALMQAFLVVGDRDSAMKQAEWLRQKRGLAYIEQGCGQCRQALNVIDSNSGVEVAATQAPGSKAQ
jgi:tetratricopeptide (TPR) repeat protein